MFFQMKKFLTLLAGVALSLAAAANVSAQGGYEVKGTVIERTVTAADTLEVVLAPGGGQAISFFPQK